MISRASVFRYDASTISSLLLIGAIDAPSTKHETRSRYETGLNSEHEAVIPLGRAGTPEDVAETVRWLASAGAGHITAQIVQVNGGAERGH